MCQLLGNTDHVGYGSDWIPDMTKTIQLIASKPGVYPDQGMAEGATKKGLSMWGPTPNPAKILPAVVDQLLEHGYSQDDCAKILGGNNLRVFDQVWSGTDVEIDDSQSFLHTWR